MLKQFHRLHKYLIFIRLIGLLLAKFNSQRFWYKFKLIFKHNLNPGIILSINRIQVSFEEWIESRYHFKHKSNPGIILSINWTQVSFEAWIESRYNSYLFFPAAFVLMISLASYGISKRTERIRPTMFDVSKLPNFFGVSVYSFMCQHSLPSILTPTEKKTRLTGILSLSFGMVTCFYLLLTITSVFCFKAEDIVDLYTLNFLSSEPFLAYFLALFPVFTLSTNFPIIAITLRENLKIIFSSQNTHCSPFAGRIIYPLITIVPPIAIAFGTQNVEMLVGVTGSYAGAVIQYVVPVMLVLCGRKKARQLSGSYVNKHRSMFRQKAWIYFVLAWTVACIGFVTANHIMSLVH